MKIMETTAEIQKPQWFSLNHIGVFMKKQDIAYMNTTVLAFLGDSVYETYVRNHVIGKGQVNADLLHRAAVRFVRADAQAFALKAMMDELSEEEQRILREMDKIYLDFPSYGSRRMGRELRRCGYRAGRLRARKLIRLLGIEAIYPRKRLSLPAKGYQIYPYLLGEVEIDRPNKVWAADITYIRLKRGFI
jgi:putative transposase